MLLFVAVLNVFQLTRLREARPFYFAVPLRLLWFQLTRLREARLNWLKIFCLCILFQLTRLREARLLSYWSFLLIQRFN